MSVDAGLYIYLEKFRASDIVKCYLKSGLDIFNNKRINLIISEDDSFERDYISADTETVFTMLDDRQDRGIISGITLYSNGEAFSDILIFPHEYIILSCDINRRTVMINKTEFTDINYYIRKFLVPLAENGYNISGYKYIENI